MTSPVTSVALTKRACACKCPLFSKKYLRPHRTNGSKVLRCFPHCCPQHTESPFCASSLGVRVTGSVPFLQHCIVLLHFEASYEPPIACGDLLDEPTIESALRTESNPRGEWIPTQVVAIEENHVVYEYNAEAESGWNYRWLGGSSTQQRRCWHCIKAYVLTRVECPADQSKLQVIAIVQSPPFVVMSYRRACKSCQKKSTVDPVLSATSREACECEGIYRLSDTHLDEIISTGVTSVAILPDLVHSSQSGDSNSPPPTSAEMERHLGLLYTALATTTIALTSDAALFQLALQLTSPSTDPKLLPPSSHAETHTRILMELLQDRAVLDEFFQEKAHSVLNQHALSRAYEEWLAHFYDNICRIVAKTHATAAAYFESLASTRLACKAGGQTASSKGFEAFVAQLREVYLAQNYSPPSPSSSSALHGTWRFDATALRILTTSLSPSVLTVARFLSMGLGLQMVLSSQSLFVRSELALFSTIWSEFVLDGTPRILRVFPNGESTMSTCADLLYGDYIGSHPPNTNQIRLDLFCWPLENDAHRTCYAIRMLLDASCGGHLQGQIEVQVAHNVTDQNTWNMTAAERVELLRRHDLTTVLVMVAGWQQNSPKDEMNIWV